MPRKDTSWNRVAKWYDRLLEADGTYQKDLILPNLVRMMGIRKGDAVLDLACGQGFFAREFAARGAEVVAADASHKLIEIARKRPAKGVRFEVARADKLPFIKSASMDKIAVVLAIQNIENVQDVFRECARVLKAGGTMAIVMNHPAFRIPKSSGWGWDDEAKVQYRRIDEYLSELKIAVHMHPGAHPDEITLTFHRPLQFYFKALAKAGFSVTGMEEWNSHKRSEPGPRAKAEDRARKEIPLFLSVIATKQPST